MLMMTAALVAVAAATVFAAPPRQANLLELFLLEAREDLETVADDVLSEGSRRHDEIRKRKLYAQHGVPEYWIVDPKIGSVEQWRLGGEAYELFERFDRASRLTTPSFPEVAIDMRRVIRE